MTRSASGASRRRTFIQELQALDVDDDSSPHQFAWRQCLRRHRDRECVVVSSRRTSITHVDALAASIASMIAIAGDEVRMADNAFLMIHEAWTLSIGNAAQLRKDADLLDKIGGSLVDAYTKKTGASKKQVTDWMTGRDMVLSRLRRSTRDSSTPSILRATPRRTSI
jgi:hypothetical protein